MGCKLQVTLAFSFEKHKGRVLLGLKTKTAARENRGKACGRNPSPRASKDQQRSHAESPRPRQGGVFNPGHM